MWQDMNLYWAWRGNGPPDTDPPTHKEIEYESFGHQRIACAVIEDGCRREVFCKERAMYRKETT